MESEHQPQNMAAAGAQVATTFLDTMKQQPVLLGLLVINLLVFAFLFYAITDLAAKRSNETMALLDKCLPNSRGGP